MLNDTLIKLGEGFDDYKKAVSKVLHELFKEKEIELDFLQLDVSSEEKAQEAIKELLAFTEKLETTEQNYYLKLNQEININGFGLNKIFIAVNKKAKTNRYDLIGLYANDIEKVTALLKEKEIQLDKHKKGDVEIDVFVADGLNFELANSKLFENTNSSSALIELEKERRARLILLADFQNYRRRIEQQKNESTDLANKSFLDQATELLDDMVRALDHAKNTDSDSKELMSGYEMIVDKFINFLKEQGLEEIPIKPGDKFDPNTMQAISTIKVVSEKEAGLVVHVDQKGYKTNSNEVFKTAKVIIGKN